MRRGDFRQEPEPPISPSPTQVRALIERGLLTADQFGTDGWLSGLQYEDQVEDLLKQRTGGRADRVRRASLWPLAAIRRSPGWSDVHGGKAVAVIRAQGPVLPGEVQVPGPTIQSSDIIRQLRAVGENKRVRALRGEGFPRGPPGSAAGRTPARQQGGKGCRHGREQRVPREGGTGRTDLGGAWVLCLPFHGPFLPPSTAPIPLAPPLRWRRSRRWCCGSTAPAATPSPRTSSGGRSSCCAGRSRWSPRSQTWPPRAVRGRGGWGAAGLAVVLGFCRLRGWSAASCPGCWTACVVAGRVCRQSLGMRPAVHAIGLTAARRRLDGACATQPATGGDVPVAVPRALASMPFPPRPGYYIAMAASYIVAEPLSITGSIGVVLNRLCAAPLLDKLGLHNQTLSMCGGAGRVGPRKPGAQGPWDDGGGPPG